VWSERSPPPAANASIQLVQQCLSFGHLPCEPQSRWFEVFHADVRVLEKVRFPVRHREQFVGELPSLEQAADAPRRASAHGLIIVDDKPARA